MIVTFENKSLKIWARRKLLRYMERKLPILIGVKEDAHVVCIMEGLIFGFMG